MARTTQASPVRRLMAFVAAALLAALAVAVLLWQRLGVPALPALFDPRLAADAALVERAAQLAPNWRLTGA